VLVVVVELGVREEQAKTMAKAGLVERASHFHPLTLQLCLQLEEEAGDPQVVVQVLLMAQELGAQEVAPQSMVSGGLQTQAVEVGGHTTLAVAVLGPQASSSSAIKLPGTSWYLWELRSFKTCP
jgi:hypothetical protein